jgi:hypothetical protein
MKYRIEKLDKRHKGNENFKYRIEFLPDSRLSKRFLNFQTMREWCWKAFGASSELNLYDRLNMEREIENTDEEIPNPVWCWHQQVYDGNGLYIYLQTEKELTFLQLKWSLDQK